MTQNRGAGKASRWLPAGLQLTGKLYLLVILVLAVAAVYEVIKVVILAAMFSN